MAELSAAAEWRTKERGIKDLRKDISTARDIIADGFVRYKKKKLKVRSKKQAEDLSFFAVLYDYGSREEIQEAFGWAYITDKEMGRLQELWDLREEKINSYGKFEDRVTKMLTHAMDNIGEKYQEVLSDFDDMVQQEEETRLRIESGERT